MSQLAMRLVSEQRPVGVLCVRKSPAVHAALPVVV